MAELGHALYARGQVPATSGNFSLRLADGDIAITASGRDKSRLGTGDILRLSAEGSVRGGGTPSAETGLHLQLYRHSSDIGAVLHTHSLDAVLASARAGKAIRFQGLELLKAFSGVHSHEQALELPVFDNDQDIPALARRVDAHMTRHGPGHGYLIRGHGLYTWGETLDVARRHLEAFDYLLAYYLRAGGGNV